MIKYLANHLPWRRFPLLGQWEVDATATESRLIQQLPDKSNIQAKLQSITDDTWVFTKTHSKRRARDSGVVDPDVESNRRYRWALDGKESLYISESLKDGQELLFKLDLIEDGRFEFFEPGRGHAVVWKRF
ncbi:MAG: hypothetical protein QNJ19_06430 [Woeseiaceae bacterium]|nr:hypothetical protein [Woeseiaceae bacterium]